MSGMHTNTVDELSACTPSEQNNTRHSLPLITCGHVIDMNKARFVSKSDSGNLARTLF